jgi:hypothetical protein
VECSEENLNQPCCIDCAAGYPAVKVIETDEIMRIHWSGKLYPSDWQLTYGVDFTVPYKQAVLFLLSE